MKNTFQQLFREALSPEVEVLSFHSVSGGDINRCYRVETSEGRWFVKCNSAHRFPEMFERESEGLDLLREQTAFRVPKVEGVFYQHDDAFLMLEWIDTGQEKQGFAEQFASALASMHGSSADFFGLSASNYIGTLVQDNPKSSSWTDFFENHRISPLLNRAVDMGLLDGNDGQYFDRICARLETWFPVEKPSLLHGDLWGGNYVASSSGEPVLIDPAVYYGHRLMDIGMMHLFGGFDPDIINYYHDLMPLPDNWREGVEIANLYPLLVHTILFGPSYASSVKAILRKYS